MTMSLQLDFPAVLERWPSFLAGAALTLELAAFATVFGALLGTLTAVGRGTHNALIARACKVYVEMIRNTPLLVQIFLVYFGLASVGMKFSAFTVAVAALTINVGAYTAEIMRAGFEAIPRGQIEAAEGLALSRLQIYWHIILLPAIERVYPALTSQFVLLMLASSVCSQISAEELTAVANYIQSDTYRAFETYIIVAVLYVILSLVMRAGFWGLGLVLFPRRRRLGTPL
jgi:polar amino acid transport system permease protein